MSCALYFEMFLLVLMNSHHLSTKPLTVSLYFSYIARFLAEGLNITLLPYLVKMSNKVNYKTKLIVNVDDELFSKIDTKAKNEYRTKASVVRELIKKHVE